MDIKTLIDKFMDGRTSLEEERMLEEYFCKEKNIPEELQPYRKMFAYFEGGMKDDGLLGGEGEPLSLLPVQETLPTGHEDASVFASRGDKTVFLRRLIAVAASVAVLIAIAFHIADGGDEAAPVAGTENGTVAQAAVADTITADTDTMRNAGGQQETTKPAHRTPRKYRYKPAPPEHLLAKAHSAAIADSVSRTASQLAEAELRKVEYEQQYMLNLIKAASIINSADIAAARDEEEAY